MTDRQKYTKKGPHNLLVSNYLNKIINNEERSSILKAQVGEIRKMYHDILEISSTYEDSTCCYELVTSPVYANYLASWDGEEGRKFGCPEYGKDLYQLQSIVEKQNNKISKLQKQVMDMRECFQIMLHNLAKDKDNIRIISDYLGNACPERKAAEPTRRIRTNAFTNEENQSLRNEIKVLRAELQTIRENVDPYSPSLGPVYNFYAPTNEVLIQSTKTVCILKGNLTSTDSSSCTTLFSSSSNSSPVMYRTKTRDDHEQQRVKLLETERWTQNIPREQRPPLPLNNQVTDETQPNHVRDSVVQEDIAITTVEYRECHIVDLQGGQANQTQTVDCHAEMELISETEHREKENTTYQSKETAQKAEMAVVPRSNVTFPVKYPVRGSPVGNSFSTDSSAGTSALLGLLFTGFCDIKAVGFSRDTADIELDTVPSTFLEVLKRIRIICKSDYGRFFKELGVEPVHSPKPQCDVCVSEPICDGTAMTDTHDATHTSYSIVESSIGSYDFPITSSVDVASLSGSHDVTRTCSGDVDVLACSCLEAELRMLNKVVQRWLKDHSEHQGHDTFPHMKMIKILNCYKRNTHRLRIPLYH